MNKIAPIKFNFQYSDSQESEIQLSRAYSILFTLVKQCIIDKERQSKINNDYKKENEYG
jgi:hypothetical protein